MPYLKVIAVWALLALAETVHGILRARLLAPRVGDLKSRQAGVLSGSLLILFIAWLTAGWLGLSSPAESARAGAVWVVLMLGYEFFLGRCVFHFPWERLLADFDVKKGGLLGLGMLVLALAPFLAGRLRGLW